MDQPNISPFLPAGWSEHANPDGPREFRTTLDGSRGVLQVSRMPWALGTDALGDRAVELGLKLGEPDASWGEQGAGREFQAQSGPGGMGVFFGGAYPSMVLWLVVAGGEALLWTWLGPDPTGDALAEAIAIVMST